MKAVVGLACRCGAPYFVVKGRQNPGEATAVAAPATQASAPRRRRRPSPFAGERAERGAGGGSGNGPDAPRGASDQTLLGSAGRMARPCWSAKCHPGSEQTVTVREAAVIDVGDAAAFAFIRWARRKAAWSGWKSDQCSPHTSDAERLPSLMDPGVRSPLIDFFRRGEVASDVHFSSPRGGHLRPACRPGRAAAHTVRRSDPA